jgi:predicted house-cleaning noncanonical NTP pyrophosphatase (MazG superfamily)
MTVSDRVHDAIYTILSRKTLTKWDRRKSFKNYVMQAVTWSLKRVDNKIEEDEEDKNLDLSQIQDFREFLQKKYSQELVNYLDMIISCGERHAEKYPQLYRDYRVALDHFLSL